MVSLLTLVCVLQLSLIFKSGVMVPSWISSFGMEWMQAIIFQNFCRSNHVSSDQNPLDRGWNLPGLSGFCLNHYGNSYQLNHVKRRRWGFWIHHQPSIIYLYIPMHFDCLKTSCGWFNPLTPLTNPFLVLKHLENPVGFCWLNPYSWLKKGFDHQKSPKITTQNTERLVTEVVFPKIITWKGPAWSRKWAAMAPEFLG